MGLCGGPGGYVGACRGLCGVAYERALSRAPVEDLWGLRGGLCGEACEGALWRAPVGDLCEVVDGSVGGSSGRPL